MITPTMDVLDLLRKHAEEPDLDFLGEALRSLAQAVMDAEVATAIGAGIKGPSKISVQTGSSHGGVVLPDGSVAQVAIDFETLEELSRLARGYGMAGAVQHGASTLPEEMFHRFPETDTAEIHLATGFQNLIYDSSHLPDGLRQEIYSYLKETCRAEWKDGQTEAQFIYKTRKKALRPFKRQLWACPRRPAAPSATSWRAASSTSSSGSTWPARSG